MVTLTHYDAQFFLSFFFFFFFSHFLIDVYSSRILSLHPTGAHFSICLSISYRRRSGRASAVCGKCSFSLHGVTQNGFKCKHLYFFFFFFFSVDYGIHFLIRPALCNTIYRCFLILCVLSQQQDLLVGQPVAKVLSLGYLRDSIERRLGHEFQRALADVLNSITARVHAEVETKKRR